MLRLRPSTTTRRFGYSLGQGGADGRRCAVLQLHWAAPAGAVAVVGVGHDDAEVDVGQRVQRVAVRDRAIDLDPAAREGGAEGSADLVAASAGFVELGLGAPRPGGGPPPMSARARGRRGPGVWYSWVLLSHRFKVSPDRPGDRLGGVGPVWAHSAVKDDVTLPTSTGPG